MNVNVTATTARDARAHMGASTSETLAIQANPKFQQLVRSRNGLAWTLSGVMLFVYLGFILLVAFDKPLLASKVGDGATSLGIVLGLVVIVLAVALCAIYVVRANGRFDDLTQELTREAGR